MQARAWRLGSRWWLAWAAAPSAACTETGDSPYRQVTREVRADADAADTIGAADSTDSIDAADDADSADSADSDDTIEPDGADGADTIEPDSDAVEVAPAPVTFDQVHAFFIVKCAPCHAGPNAATSDGEHNMANPDVGVAYAASQLQSLVPGRTKGALALQYVRAGIMPLGAGCSGDPVEDAAKPACLTAAQLDLLARWVADGQLPPE